MSEKNADISSACLKKMPTYLVLNVGQNFFSFLKKKKRAAFGGEYGGVRGWWWGWGMVSKGRGYDFDVCDKLENSTTTPSAILCFRVKKI